MALSDHGPYSGVVDIARNGIDELIRLKAQAKQDEALMRQLVEAMEGVKALNMGGELALWTAEFDRLLSAITAAQARLGEKP